MKPDSEFVMLDEEIAELVARAIAATVRYFLAEEVTQ